MRMLPIVGKNSVMRRLASGSSRIDAVPGAPNFMKSTLGAILAALAIGAGNLTAGDCVAATTGGRASSTSDKPSGRLSFIAGTMSSSKRAFGSRMSGVSKNSRTG